MKAQTTTGNRTRCVKNTSIKVSTKIYGRTLDTDEYSSWFRVQGGRQAKGNHETRLWQTQQTVYIPNGKTIKHLKHTIDCVKHTL